MILEIQKNLSESVRAAVKAAFDVPLESVTFQYPPRPELGDLAITAPFDLAKTLRRKPREVAERLSADLGGTDGVRKAEVAGGGYVNVFLERGAVLRGVHERLTGPRPSPRAADPRRSSSTRASIPTRPPTSATCATPSSATPSCAC